MPNFPAAADFARPAPTSRLSKSDTCCSRAERCCWTFATWLPIAIVYGATTWAVYVNVYLLSISFVKGLQGLLFFPMCLLIFRMVFRDPWTVIIRTVHMVLFSSSI